MQLLLNVKLVQDGGLRRVDSWVKYRIRVRIHPIEVEPLGVVSPVATFYTIWIQEWDNLKDELLEK